MGWRVSKVEADLTERLKEIADLQEEIRVERENSGHAEDALREELGEANIRVSGLQQQLLSAQNEVAELGKDLRKLRSRTESQEGPDLIRPTKAPVLSSVPCSRCGELESRLTQLETAALNTSESGIEDAGPGSSAEDGKSRLRAELESAQTLILDLRTALSIASSQDTRKRAAGETLNASYPNLAPNFSVPRLSSVDTTGIKGAEWVMLAGENERLREEAFLLESRLAAKDDLLAETVAKYRAQLKETAGLGRLVEELWNGGGEGEGEWREVEARLADLSQGLSKGL